MNRKKFGQLGEEKVCDFLLKNGYLILQRNVRYGRNELDIIAIKQNIYFLIEVKNVSNINYLNVRNEQKLSYNRYIEKYLFDQQVEVMVAIINENKIELVPMYYD